MVAIALPRKRCTLAFMSTPPTANYKTAGGVFALVNVGEIWRGLITDLYAKRKAGRNRIDAGIAPLCVLTNVYQFGMI